MLLWYHFRVSQLELTCQSQVNARIIANQWCSRRIGLSKQNKLTGLIQLIAVITTS